MRAGIFQDDPTGQGGEISTQYQRDVLYIHGRQVEQRAAVKNGVGEPGMLYIEGVQGGEGSAESDAPAGIPVGAGILEHGTFKHDL